MTTHIHMSTPRLYIVFSSSLVLCLKRTLVPKKVSSIKPLKDCNVQSGLYKSSGFSLFGFIRAFKESITGSSTYFFVLLCLKLAWNSRYIVWKQFNVIDWSLSNLFIFRIELETCLGLSKSSVSLFCIWKLKSKLVWTCALTYCFRWSRWTQHQHLIEKPVAKKMRQSF